MKFQLLGANAAGIPRGPPKALLDRPSAFPDTELPAAPNATNASNVENPAKSAQILRHAVFKKVSRVSLESVAFRMSLVASNGHNRSNVHGVDAVHGMPILFKRSAQPLKRPK